jgi:hypothetical protein
MVHDMGVPDHVEETNLGSIGSELARSFFGKLWLPLSPIWRSGPLPALASRLRNSVGAIRNNPTTEYLTSIRALLINYRRLDFSKTFGWKMNWTRKQLGFNAWKICSVLMVYIASLLQVALPCIRDPEYMFFPGLVCTPRHDSLPAP